MAVNVSKTKFIIFHNKSKSIELENPAIIFNDSDPSLPIDPSKSKPLSRIYNNNPNPDDRAYKLLGVYFDENLSFEKHASIISSKIAKANFIINRAKNFLPSSLLTTLYYSLVHPHTTYCLPIYSGAQPKHLQRIKNLHKKTIRIISKKPYATPFDEVCKLLNILPFDDLIKYSQGILTHSIYHQQCPEALWGEWVKNSERGVDYGLRNADDFLYPSSPYRKNQKAILFRPTSSLELSTTR
jgi:hypothetical protein